MSASTRFASLTADLLARKGEAQPSANLTLQESPAAWREPRDSFQTSTMLRRLDRATEIDRISTSFLPATSSPPHRVSLTLTQSEFEMLGIAGVKLGINRKQLFRRAVDLYLEKLEKDYRFSCRCISTNPSCCNHDAD